MSVPFPALSALNERAAASLSPWVMCKRDIFYHSVMTRFPSRSLTFLFFLKKGCEFPVSLFPKDLQQSIVQPVILLLITLREIDTFSTAHNFIAAADTHDTVYYPPLPKQTW